MQTKAFYSEKPEKIHFMTLPTGEADLWLRKDVKKTSEGYEAVEVYMRTVATRAEVEANFEDFYEKASAWKPGERVESLSQEERIRILEEELRAAKILLGVE